MDPGGAHGTPMGYVLNEHGAIASELAMAPTTETAERKGPAKPVAKGNKPLNESRLNRSGC